MKRLSIILLSTLFCLTLMGQHYIGMSKTDIIKLMNKTNPGFDLDEGVVNKTYNYLKFVDKYNEETWLFFLSEDNICTHTKLMSDFSNLNLRTKYLNDNYKKSGASTWTYTVKGVTYNVELIKEEWYFTIVTKKKK